MRMAKTSFNHNYGLPLDRGTITPRPVGLTEEQYLIYALKEGYALLEAESKPAHPKTFGEKPPKPSVKPATNPEASKVQDALAKMSDNPYVRARQTILTKMSATDRSAIEKMENGTLTKDHRWVIFCREVAELGDKLSSKN